MAHSDRIMAAFYGEPGGVDMHENLEWLAKHAGEWPDKPNLTRVRFNKQLSGAEFYDPEHCNHSYGFTYRQLKQARQDLGLIATDEEEEYCRQLYKQLNEAKSARKAEDFLRQAANLLIERGKEYDQPGGERSMGKTITAFNAITGRDLSEAEGWLIMSLVKRVRQYSNPAYHKDSAEDAVNYGALEAEALEASHGES